MSEYTPTTDEVETCYHEFAVHLVNTGDTSFPVEFSDWRVGQAAFNRWLAKHDWEIVARTWEASAIFLEEYWTLDTAEAEEIVRESAEIFRQQADEIRKEAKC